MTINEIRESGLLELYVMDALNSEELTQVEQALRQYPELKTDLNNIERTLQSFAYANAVQPSSSLKEKILEEARNSKNISNNKNTTTEKSIATNRGLFTALVIAASLLAAFFAYKWYSINQQMKEMERRHLAEKEACDSIQEASARQYAIYQDLTNPNNKIIANATVEKFPETEIYFYYNEAEKKNYLMLSALPEINDNTQSYQLWSIKGTDPPRPLDVFQSDVDLLAVQFVDDTEVYAITIEQKGGVQSPTLDDLIGTFAI